MSDRETRLIEDAEVIFLNFSGLEGKYNRAGDRNFCVILREKDAVEMAADGWNVKTLGSRDPEDKPRPYVQVSVAFGKRPPKIVMVTSKGRTTLTEDECELIDWIDILKVDLILRPYDWAVSGNTGRKAYLKSFFVTVDEDFLDMKYADVPEIGAAPQRAAIETRPHADWEGEVVDD